MQVLITKPKKKTERSFFYCRRQAERSEVVEGYKVLQNAGSFNFHHLCFKWVLYHKIWSPFLF